MRIQKWVSSKNWIITSPLDVRLADENGDTVVLEEIIDKPTGNDFIHSVTLIIVDPDGKITRYMNGIYFLPFELKMSLIGATLHRGSIFMEVPFQRAASFIFVFMVGGLYWHLVDIIWIFLFPLFHLIT